MTGKCDIGMIGLGVMGANLALNFIRHGYKVAAYDRASGTMDEFISGDARSKTVKGCRSLAELAENLAGPRKILLMVTAGKTVDDLIGQLIPLLDKGDIIIDGGNSYYRDTIRRTRYMERHGFRFVGAGISGGAEGALNGPAVMAGGTQDAWMAIRQMMESIAAKARDGVSCCDWMGSDGAGHFVKMVHNGIEYADMQLIAESADFLRRGAGFDTETLSAVFAQWNKSELESYLIGITAEILRRRDESTGAPLVDMILDTAGQKGTGQWTGMTAMEIGIPAPTIAEAVFSRFMSAMKEERIAASNIFPGPDMPSHGFDRDEAVTVTGQALLMAKICSYAQGFQLLSSASRQFEWRIDLARVARVWRAGCIIRAKLLDHISDAYEMEPELPNLILARSFRDTIKNNQNSLRKIISMSIGRGIPVPAMSSAIAWYDGYRSGRLPAYLIQAQRDCFGSHTYERVDRPRGESFHTDWAGDTK